jgi:NadR type nicotinamide-nucleotide adenylyltransferase
MTKRKIKIAVTGPESTGKSELSKALSRYLNAGLVEEFAREYLEKLNRSYDINDLIYISQNQINKEIKICEEHDLIICDTDTTVLKIWCENAYGYLHPSISNDYEKTNYNLYLLCDVDLPWEPDPLREHPDKREYFFKIYKQELERKGRKFEIVKGTHKERLQSALGAIQKHFPDLFKPNQ